MSRSDLKAMGYSDYQITLYFPAPKIKQLQTGAVELFNDEKVKRVLTHLREHTNIKPENR